MLGKRGRHRGRSELSIPQAFVVAVLIEGLLGFAALRYLGHHHRKLKPQPQPVPFTVSVTTLQGPTVHKPK
ncbi:MAG TPA: hypothetical protein VKA76_07030, partial [Gammaproteobacteria bacterium]|nr:hypothetical protein [Gammaproteobacteria bacterium]